jgi:O-antigen/teichoic acid export membrane protein
LISAPYVARVLLPEGVGLYNFICSYVSYFVLFATLGIPNYGIREIAKIKNERKASERFISHMMTIELITTVIMSIAFFASLWWLDQAKGYILLFIISGISLYTTPFKIEWFYIGREEIGFITLRSLIVKTISFIGLFIFVQNKDDLIYYVLLSVFATIANELWNYSKLFKLGIRPYICFKDVTKHLKPVLILFFSSVAISVYCSLDTLMLGLLTDYEQVGYYSTAMQLVKILLYLVTSLSIVAMPRVSSLMHNSQVKDVIDLMNKSIGIVTLLGFPICLGLILISPVFTPLFFGISFENSVLPMQIGSFVIIAIGLNNLNGIQILTSLGFDKQFFISVLGGAIANFILNLLLIPQYGASGAALSSVYAELQILFTNEYFVRKYTPIKITNWSDPLKSILGVILFFPITYSLSYIVDGWLFVISSVILCSVVYFSAEYYLKNSMIGQIQIMVLNFIKRKK